ncbi:MAG: class I SAM-dependent DNA methyltransferase [Bacteroidia bacterium]
MEEDKNKNAVQIFNKLAKLYESKFMNVNLYGDTFDFFCDNIKKQNAEVLELACGPGNITKYLLNKRSDLKIFGTDLSPNMISLAKTNNPTTEFAIMDCREIGNLNKKYDAIMCGFCLPYLSKEETEKLVADSFSILNTGGLLYLSTMEDDYSKSDYKKGSTGEAIFMHYYPADFLKRVLKENNFRILKEERKNYLMQEVPTTDLILIAERNS